MGLSLIVSGLANNAIIPLEHKMTLIYDVSDTKVSLSVILSFLTFSLSNLPANYIIDTKGLRTSFLIGTLLYSLGTLAYALINVSYNLVILGTMLLGMGQPFLLNCPAKVAAFWFYPHNVNSTYSEKHDHCDPNRHQSCWAGGRLPCPSSCRQREQ